MRIKTIMLPWLLGLALIPGVGAVQTVSLMPLQELGKSIFFDDNLSINGNQSCAACHAPEAGWTGPDAAINAAGAVYEGSIQGQFGNRKPPSSAYATQSPILHYLIQKKEALFVGGNFWDGRATGEKLGNPAADQAQGPFLNPLEQALDAPADVVSRVCASAYATLFTDVWGAEICDPENVSTAYDKIALSIAAYEASPESNAFSSKFDLSFKGKAVLTTQERRGFALFKGQGKCARCHTVTAGGEKSLFTDFTYDNLGVPRNPDNPFYGQTEFNPSGKDWIDLGLGDFLKSRLDYERYASANYGKQKVPTLRNVDKWDPILGPQTKAYAHNGYFKTLKQIVHFYNTRDTKPTCADGLTRVEDAIAQGCWPAPEVAANVNTTELGNLGLTPQDEDAIVAFMKALSDGYEPKP